MSRFRYQHILLKIGSLRASLFRIPFKIINFACTRGPSGRIPYIFANKTKTSQNLYGICDFKSRSVVLYVFLQSQPCLSTFLAIYKIHRQQSFRCSTLNRTTVTGYIEWDTRYKHKRVIRYS